MGQKTNPVSLRPISEQYRGVPYWDQPKFNYTAYNTHKLIKACYKNTPIYLSNINITISHKTLIVKQEIIHLPTNTINQPINKKASKEQLLIKRADNPWVGVLKRLHISLKLLQRYTGYKKIKFVIKRYKIYKKNIPKTFRQKTNFYIKGFNKVKFNFAQSGFYLIYALMKQNVNVECLNTYIRDNLRTRSRRKKHTDFLRFIKQSLDIFYFAGTIKGIRIQIKGRFGHKPKGRSKTWKYQIGAMPLNTLKASFQSKFQQSQTKLGSVGVKLWIFTNYATT